MKIDLEKIITQAVTVLVVAVFMGAAGIVWRGATSVDTKVSQTREDMQHLIDSLSGQLASFQIQLFSISNQLVSVTSQLTNRPSVPRYTIRPEEQITQQKALKSDIYDKLRK